VLQSGGEGFWHFFFHCKSGARLASDTSEIDFVDRSEPMQELPPGLSQPVKAKQDLLPLGSASAD
jgi:hypothetical protein